MSDVSGVDPSCFLSDEGSSLETLVFTFYIGSTPTYLYFDLYLNTVYAARCVYPCISSLLVWYDSFLWFFTRCSTNVFLNVFHLVNTSMLVRSHYLLQPAVKQAANARLTLSIMVVTVFDQLNVRVYTMAHIMNHYKTGQVVVLYAHAGKTR